jgi:hypothetical protein
MPNFAVPVTFYLIAESSTEAERIIGDYLDDSAFLFPSLETAVAAGIESARIVQEGDENV